MNPVPLNKLFIESDIADAALLHTFFENWWIFALVFLALVILGTRK